MHTSDSFMITIKDCNGCLLAVNFFPPTIVFFPITPISPQKKIIRDLYFLNFSSYNTSRIPLICVGNKEADYKNKKREENYILVTGELFYSNILLTVAIKVSKVLCFILLM